VGQILAAALDNGVEEAIRLHYGIPEAARPFTSGARTVPLSVLGTDDAYWATIRRRVNAAWVPQVHAPRLHAFAEPLPNGDVLLSVSLLNETQPRQDERLQDMSLYDARVEVRVLGGGTIVPQRFRLAPDDYRYEDLAEVIGRGRRCVAVPAGDDGVASETLPLHVQRVVRHRTDHIPALEWSALAQNPLPILRDVEDAMRAYGREWDAFLAGLSRDRAAIREASTRDRDAFLQEVERFTAGRVLLTTDPELLRAFCLANRVFSRAGAARGYTSWRPFQLVYIVSHLAALAARRHRGRPDLAAELTNADVLWFPTGGGKTEAYLGLIAVALFYDRLRGKGRGMTAMLRFPLRMLSAQQLERILRILVIAEAVRLEESLHGSPFELGYLVGGSNTPGMLRFEGPEWWPGMASANRMTEAGRRRGRLIASCPLCGTENAILLRPDAQTARLFHTCGTCGRNLPLHISDEEVYRYQPAVVVSTIDKVTGFAHYGDFTSLNHGPAYECPQHGYFTFGGCLATGCQVPARQMARVQGWLDPVPALIVQDELHLVAEELGAFSAHFESLLAELQRGSASRLPSKILAASATIQGYEDQVRHVYGRHPRRFPSPGFERARSFYVIEVPDVRRLFLGVMPTGGGTSKVEVAGRIEEELVLAIQDLQDNPTLLREMASGILGRSPEDEEVSRWLFDYEVSLAYVNRRGDGARISDDLRALGQSLVGNGRDDLKHELLNADVPIAELASAINRIERITPATPRSERLRALVGTSVVSHGVDLERLNLMVMTGLPPTIADYIQATSRAGRTHAGLVVTVFDHFVLREASSFSHFMSMHTFLDRLVEVVPVNKYARLAINRTLPALTMAILWDLARDTTLGPPHEGIRKTRQFSPWWNARATDIVPRLEERLEAALRAPVPEVADPPLEDELVEWAMARWQQHERPAMEAFRNDKTKDLFAGAVLTSLRDVDEPAYFAAAPRNDRAFGVLTRP
jgi:hypothetical protein